MARIVALILAIPLAWHYGPLLIGVAVAVAPWVGAVLSFMAPDMTGRNWAFWLSFIIGLAVLWVVFRLSFFVFGFALPQAQRFTATKLLRRVQGAFAEAVFAGAVIAVGTGVLMLGQLAGIGETRAIAKAQVPQYAELLGLGGGDRPVLSALGAGARPQPMDQRDRIQKGLTAAAAEAEYQSSLRLWEDAQATFARQQAEYDARIRAGARGALHNNLLLWGVITLAAWWHLLLPLGIIAVIVTGDDFKRSFGTVYLSVLRFIEAGRFGYGGSARFAALVEEWPLRWNAAQPVEANTLFVGRSLYDRGLHVGLTDDRHMLTVAGSRAGKGTTAIIPNLLTHRGSCIVIDPKGTNAAVTSEARRRMGQDVFIVDPFQVVTKDGATFNPLDTVDLKSPMVREQIGSLADALVVAEKDVRARHWDDGARTVIRGLLTEIRTGGYPEQSLTKLRDLLTLLPDDQARLWVKMQHNTEAGGAARDAASRIISGIQTDEIRNILSNAHKHTEWLSSPAMKATLSSSSFKFSQVREKPTTIYLVLPLSALEEHRRFLRLFINMAIMQMSVGGKSKIPVLMILDEFLTLGHMREVEKAFVFMAGYNLTLWPFAQDYGQLQELYGDAVSSFVTNSRAVQVFGVSDPKTTGFVSEALGRRSMKYVWGVDMLRSEPFRQPDEVAKEISVDAGLQYILRAGKAPLILERVPYFEDAKTRWPEKARRARWFPFKDRYAPDPDYV